MINGLNKKIQGDDVLSRNNFRLTSRLVAMLVILVPAIAWSGGTGTLLLGDDASQISWQDNGAIRIDESDGEYVIVRDNVPYMVTTENDKTSVIDLTGMAEFLAEFDGELQNNPYSWGKMETFRETKSRETVAGIEGNVYAITLKDPNGQTESLEAVLTDNKLVVELTKRYAETLKNVFDVDEVGDLLAALPKDQRGVLRFGRYLRVKSISGDEPKDELFELQAEPISFGDWILGQ